MGAQTIYPNQKEQRQAENQTVVSKAASATLELYETIVKVTLPAGATDVALTLPSVGSAKGLGFFIWVGTKTGTGVLTIQDQDDAAVGPDFVYQLRNAGDAVYVQNIGGRMYTAIPVSNGAAVFKIPLPTSANTDVGALVKWQNPFGVPALIDWFALQITDAAAESETVDAGIDDDGDVSDDTLIDGGALDALAVLSNKGTPGTNGLAGVVLPASEYIVATASGAITSFAGYAYIVARPLV